MTKNKTIKLFFLSFFMVNIITSQVTIGSGIAPGNGALLDLKDKIPDINNANSDKGIIIPRVFLNDINTLDDINKNTPNRPNKTEHMGLMIYNVNGNLSTEISGDNKGLFIWNGIKWNPLNHTQNPWYKIGTTSPALQNTDNIYLKGSASIGKSSIRDGVVLDVEGNTTIKGTVRVEAESTKPASADAFIPPTMTGIQLEAKDNAYNNTHDGAIVYITEARKEGGKTIKTQNINAIGYYYYDAKADPSQGSGKPGLWIPMKTVVSVRQKTLAIITKEAQWVPARNSDSTPVTVDVTWNSVTGNNASGITLVNPSTPSSTENLTDIYLPPRKNFKVTGSIGVSDKSGYGTYVASRFALVNADSSTDYDALPLSTWGYTESSTETYNDGGVSNPICFVDTGENGVYIRLIASTSKDDRNTWISGSPNRSTLGTYLIIEEL